MAWRVDRNEDHYSDARKIAWEYVLPFRHIPILDEDDKKVAELTAFLEKTFSRCALRAAVKRMEARNEQGSKTSTD